MYLKHFLLCVVIINLTTIANSETFSEELDEIIDNILDEDSYDYLNQYNITRASLKGLIILAKDLFNAAIPTSGVTLDVEKDTWWGGPQRFNDSTIRPFRVVFSKKMISDLRLRIFNRASFTCSLSESNNTYGTNSDLQNYVLQYWATRYNFTEREERLNKHPQYIVNIQGLDIHYIHIKPTGSKKSVPIIMIHGFPVTAFEYQHVIDLMLETQQNLDFEFEIIVPTMCGYGFSEATNLIGLSPYRMGVIFNNLMSRLGHERYVIQCGDLGYFVGDAMCVMYPDRIIGFHTNTAASYNPKTLLKFFLGSLNPTAVVEAKYQTRMYPLTTRVLSYLENFGYFHEQATRPDNLGIGILDSPSGLSGWLLHLFLTGANRNNINYEFGQLTTTYDLDDIVDNLTLYWITKSSQTAMRLYAEFSAWLRDPLNCVILSTPTQVPYAVIKSPYDISYNPDEFLMDKYPNLVQSTTLDYGGHFAGFENPSNLADSIVRAIPKFLAFQRSDIV